MRQLSRVVVALALAGLLGIFLTGRAFSQAQICSPVAESTEEGLPGVVLTWDSSFRCADVPDYGTYEVIVLISTSATSSEVIRLERLELTHTTPRPRRQAPEATAQVVGLPATLYPGDGVSVTVTGQYELVTTGEGQKGTLHFRALGRDLTSGEPVNLGIAVHLRGPGATEGRGAGPAAAEPAGPPAWAPGPPPWVEEREARPGAGEARGRPAWAPGPPPWAGGPPPWARNR